MKILEGKTVRDEIATQMRGDISARKHNPRLVIIQVGDREESNRYIEQKKVFADRIGAEVIHTKNPETISAKEIITEITAHNQNNHIHGIIVQLPLPAHLVAHEIINAISLQKDVDGMTEGNLKLLWENKGGFIPATTRGICTLLDHYGVELQGKKITMVGRSTLVGKPTALLMTNRDATVTLCHSKTKDLASETKRADIVIAAIGKPHFFTKEYFGPGQIVIDVGINLVSGKKLDEEIPRQKLVGDVDFESVKNMVAGISPVPGGVGPLTVASLFQNLYEAYLR